MFKRHIMRGTLCLFVLSLGLYLGLSPAVHAQSKEDSGKGLIWYEGVMGTSSSLGSVTRFDSTLGYNFNHHFGVDFGAPVLFVHSSSTTTTTYRSANGIGDVYTDRSEEHTSELQSRLHLVCRLLLEKKKNKNKRNKIN